MGLRKYGQWQPRAAGERKFKGLKAEIKAALLLISVAVAPTPVRAQRGADGVLPAVKSRLAGGQTVLPAVKPVKPVLLAVKPVLPAVNLSCRRANRFVKPV